MRMPDEMRFTVRIEGPVWSPTPARPYPSTSEMLQQMAAESTGTAAPIHLQGEPMATAPTPNLDAVPGHSVTVSSVWHGGSRRDSWAECECGWSGTKHHDGGDRLPGVSPRQDGLAHAAQFKAPELCAAETAAGVQCSLPVNHAGQHRNVSLSVYWSDVDHRPLDTELLAHAADGGQLIREPADWPHLQAYAAKRAEWLKARHQFAVAQRTLDIVRGRAIEARRVQREAQSVADAAAAHRDACSAESDNLEGELWALVKGEQA